MSYDAKYRKRYELDRSRGHHRTTNPAPVIAHLQTLQTAGMTKRSIAEAASVSPSTITSLTTTTQPTVRATTAARILAVTPDHAHTRAYPDGFVPARGTRRRIQALLALGWTHKHMHALTGVRTAVLLHQAGHWVTKANHDKITTLYDRLSMSPGPSTRTRARATTAGYAPPLAWDDTDLDAQDATPAGTGTSPGRRPSSVLLTEATFLLSLGEAPAQIAHALHVTEGAIARAAQHAGNYELARTFQTITTPTQRNPR